MSTELQIDRLEVELLVQGIFHRWGYDFSEYTEASRLRRIREYLKIKGKNSIADLIHDILTDKAEFYNFLSNFTVTTSEMFRDPDFFLALKENIFPILESYPSFRIWHAGCSTGEEVYSLAILLQEAGLLDKATIFGTDVNPSALKAAREGIFARNHMRSFSRNYYLAGGQSSLTDYFTVERDYALVDPHISKKVNFYEHNLVCDGVFSQFEMIFCRNVMIYFEKPLQNRVLELLTKSLSRGGILCLGNMETLNFTPFLDSYIPVVNKHRIYQCNLSPIESKSKPKEHLEYQCH